MGILGVYDSFPFEPDSVLPRQFFSPPTMANTPERRLMRAVLESALHEYQANKSMESRRARRLFYEAEEWFRSTDTTWFFSFENICDVLELSASAIRTTLFRENSPTHSSSVRCYVSSGRIQITMPVGHERK